MLSIQRSFLRQALVAITVFPKRNTWIGGTQPWMTRATGLRPFHTAGVMSKSNEGQLTPEFYQSLMMQQVFKKMEGEDALSAATDTEKLNTAVLGDKYGTAPKKKYAAAKEIVQMKAKSEGKTKKPSHLRVRGAKKNFVNHSNLPPQEGLHLKKLKT